MNSLEKSSVNVSELVQRALEARKLAYSRYSQFNVGAALLCTDGTIYTGSNVENASYSLTICAERVALVKAVSEGRTNFVAMAVSELPCGACRQFMREFGDYDVYLIQPDSSVHETSVTGLLPNAFTTDMLSKPT